MLHLFIKEINAFFSGISGYLVIFIFLLLTGLMLWVFPGEMNIPDSGYASLEPLFFLAPWVFLFLVPAVTMKMIAEEKKNGTLELLLTRPLTGLQIVQAKYFASLALIGLALIPTLVYYYSIILLGNPIGNIDTGATWGSFIGLFLLAASYASIGIFASAITDNQIVAFLIAVLLSFLIYMGFDYATLAGAGDVLMQLGINEHYQSISRGVVVISDISYFICLIALFIVMTEKILRSKIQ